MKEISRRNFLGMMGAMGAMGAVGTLSGCAPTSANAAEGGAGQVPEVVLSDGTVWRGTPEHIAALGGSTMPLEELNRRRGTSGGFQAPPFG